jgi:hypothetical protein
LRNELRRVIFAFAARTASVLDFVFGSATGRRTGSFESDVAGSTGGGIVELRSAGCMLMGPAYRGLLLCIRDNA